YFLYFAGCCYFRKKLYPTQHLVARTRLYCRRSSLRRNRQTGRSSTLYYHAFGKGLESLSHRINFFRQTHFSSCISRKRGIFSYAKSWMILTSHKILSHYIFFNLSHRVFPLERK